MGLIQDYLTARRGYAPVINIAKVEILDVDEGVLEEITTDIIDGSVTVSKQNGSRRTASITLNNKSGVYTIDPDGKFWINTKFRIWSGIQTNSGTRHYFSQGIFVMGEPYEEVTASSTIVRLELYDKFALLDGTLSGLLLNAIIVPVDSNVVDAIKAVFTEAFSTQPLISYDQKPLIADDSTAIMPYTLRIDEGGTYFDVLNKLTEAITMDIYYDKDGFPRLETPVDYNTEPAVLSITETDNLKIGLSKQIAVRDIKNSVRVVGGDFGTGEIFDATASDTNVTSSTRIALIGKRQKLIQDDVIYTTELAQLRADYELSKAIQATESISVQFVPIDFLDVDDIIEITDEGLQLVADRHLVRQLTIPIIHSSGMTAEVWRTRTFT